MAPSDVRDALILAAERLISERGADVPLRDIAVLAGQRNNSAVHYYFGSRAGLIDAIVERRMVALEQRRMELLAQTEVDGTANDMRTLVWTLAAPLLEIPRREGATHYLRFLEVVRNHPVVTDISRLTGTNRSASRIITTRLDKALGDQALGDQAPIERRTGRLRAMSTTMFALLADYERACDGENASGNSELDADEIVDLLVGLLTAQTSATKARALS